MATYLENLITRREAVASKLAALEADNMDLPDSPGNPLHVERVAKIDAYYRELREINQLIASADGAYEVTSEMTAL